MIKAAIDIGSNSILLLIAKIQNGVLFDVLNESRITSLGKDIDINGKINDESARRSIQALKEYRDILQQHNISPCDTIVTATEALRTAKNRELFLNHARELGFNINILTARGEAHYTALGVVSSLNVSSAQLVIMDIGGASTELIVANHHPFEIVKSISLKCGAVRGQDWTQAGIFDDKMREILSHNELADYKTSHLTCVAGSMTSLAGMILGLQEFNDTKINRHVIKFEKFWGFVDKLKKRNAHELLEQFPFLGKRASTIVAGANIAMLIGKKLNVETFEISTLGLRHGVCFATAINQGLTGGFDEQFIYKQSSSNSL